MDRCKECNKKTLVLATCKCGEKFCLKHRYPETHTCMFDHKTTAKEILNKQLYKVQADKVINRI